MQNKETKIKMVYYILNYLLDYLGYFIGGGIQLLFILLPITLKNWEDDGFNSMTYISFQLFVAGIIFLISPYILEFRPISSWAQVLLLACTGIVAFFRVIKLIPLEFTYPIKLPVILAKDLVFEGFHTKTKYQLLHTLDFENPDAEFRYNAFREQLKRVKGDQGSDVKDDMIVDLE